MNSDIKVIHDTLSRVQDVYRNDINDLSDCFAGNARLIITPSNKCTGSCYHCVADSTPSGQVMDYDKFKSIDPEFFKIFKIVDFGRRGNPLNYLSDEHDLADMINQLYKAGIKFYTIAAGIQSRESAVKRLELFVSERNVNIETMVTYHHYFQYLDKAKLAQSFNKALKQFMKFSNKILISLLADKSIQDEVESKFKQNKDKIFEGIEIDGADAIYKEKYDEYKSEISIPPTDTRVYPLGRFRAYLENAGMLEQYEKTFEAEMSDYTCPDLVKWPGIIIEPNGDLNACASFEAIACRGAVISNIFEKSFDEVKKELIDFHKREMDWFIANIDDIIAGKVSTCKLKNGCYQPSNS